MRYLVDGYNLAHAMGLLRGRAAPHALEAARRDLVLHLAAAHGPGADVTVVFDASRLPPGASARQEQNGVHVVFAVGQTADDVIEELLRADATPVRTTVVSSDRRLKEAARRRGARALACTPYLDELARPRPPAAPPAPDPNAKPDGVTPEEARRLLDAFGEADDPKPQREF